MPRNGSGVYSKPSGTTAVSGEIISSTSYNTMVDDLVSDANIARPVSAGGTGSTTAAAARSALGLGPANDVSFSSVAATGSGSFGGTLSAVETVAVTNGSGFAQITLDDTRGSDQRARVYHDGNNQRAAFVFGSQDFTVTYGSVRLELSGITFLSGGVTLGTMFEAGTSAGLATTVITREKGDARYLGISAQAASAANADTVDGKHASEFLGATAKAADSDLLDGLNSSQFLRKDIAEQATGQFGADKFRTNVNGSESDPAIKLNDPDIGIYFNGSKVAFTLNGNTNAVLAPSGSSVSVANDVITREKGDARYASISSSLRYKEDAEPWSIDGGVFDALDLYAWRWGGELAEDDPRRGEAGVGLIAEAVAQHFPEAVIRREDGSPEGLDALPLIGALFAEVKALRARVAVLEAR